MTIRDIAIAFGYKVDKKTEKTVEKSITDLKNTAKAALGAIGVGLSLGKANALIEEFKQVNLQLKNAVGNSEDFAKVQNEVLGAANNVRVSYATMTSYAKGLMNSQNKLFSSSEKTLEFAELTTKAMKAAGANESVISSLNSGIQSAFETGKVSAGTFTTLMQNCPEVVSYLSKTLGVTEQQVKALGNAGAITSNQLYSAFTSNASAIDKAYSNTSYTVTEALTYIRNKFGMWLYQLDDTLKITHTISKIMMRAFSSIMNVLKKVTAWIEKVNNRLGGAEKTLKLFSILAGSLFATFNAGKILSFLGSLKGVLGLATGKVMLIVAAVALLALCVEDFFHFLKGNDSMFGEVLSSMGIDAEEVRNQLLGAFGDVKDSLFDLFDTLKNTLGVAFEAIKPSIKSIIELLVKTVVQVLPVLSKVISVVSRVISKLAEAVLPILGEIIGKVISKVADIIGKILPKIIGLIEKLFPLLEEMFDAALPIIVSLLDLIIPLLDVLFDVIDPLLDIVIMLFDVLTPIIGMLLQVLVPLLKLIAVVLEPIISIVKVLAKLIAGNLSRSIKTLKAILEPIIKLIAGNLKIAIKNIVTVITTVIGFIQRTIENVKKIFSGIIDFITGVFTGNWSQAWDGIKTIFSGIWDQIKNVFSTVFDFFKEIGGNIVEGISGVFADAWNGIKNAWSGVTDFFTGIWDGIKGAFSAVTDWFSNVFSGAWNAVKNVFSAGGKVFDGIVGSIKDVFTDVVNAIIRGINKVVAVPFNAINAVLSKLKSIDILGVKPFSWVTTFTVPEIPELAEGGYVEANKPRQVIIGDNKQEGEIVSPISKMRKTVLEALKMFTSASVPTGSISTLGKETSNRNLSQIVNITNQFNGGTPEQQKNGAKAMKKSAQDATGIMARGLAYAR